MRLPASLMPVKASQTALVAVCVGGLAVAACTSTPDEPTSRSEVTVTYETAPSVIGIYQVSNDGPIDSSALTSEQFRRELVQASAKCDPGGEGNLVRRLSLSQSGKFEDGIKLVIRVAAGTNSSECASYVADSAVGLMRSSEALRPLRRIEDITKLILTGSVSERPQPR